MRATVIEGPILLKGNICESLNGFCQGGASVIALLMCVPSS